MEVEVVSVRSGDTEARSESGWKDLNPGGSFIFQPVRVVLIHHREVIEAVP